MRRKTDKTKILYIITKSNWGGAQKYVFDMATNVAKNGYEVAVALGGDGELKKRIDDMGIRTAVIPNLKRDINMFSEWRVFFGLLKILKSEKPDIVHLNSSKVGGLGALAARFAGIKRIVFTAHGWAYKEDRDRLSKGAIKFFSWLTVIFSHMTITVSYYDFKTAPKLFTRKKIIMIHNGISEIKLKDKATARKEIVKKIQFRSDLNKKKTVWIGTISELHKNKGLLFIIQAINKLIKKGYDILFFMIGDGEEEARLIQFIKNIKLQDNVFLLGHIDKASELLPAFDIFTLTSTKEGLPYVLLEAGLAGLPVVATRAGGIPEIIENGKSGRLAQTKNSHDIENAISDIIDFKKDGIRYGDNLKAKIKKDFTIEQMVAETLSSYS